MEGLLHQEEDSVVGIDTTTMGETAEIGTAEVGGTITGALIMAAEDTEEGITTTGEGGGTEVTTMDPVTTDGVVEVEEEVLDPDTVVALEGDQSGEEITIVQGVQVPMEEAMEVVVEIMGVDPVDTIAITAEEVTTAAAVLLRLTVAETDTEVVLVVDTTAKVE